MQFSILTVLFLGAFVAAAPTRKLSYPLALGYNLVNNSYHLAKVDAKIAGEQSPTVDDSSRALYSGSGGVIKK